MDGLIILLSGRIWKDRLIEYFASSVFFFSLCFEDSMFIDIRPKTGVLNVQPAQLPETPAQKDLALGV